MIPLDSQYNARVVMVAGPRFRLELADGRCVSAVARSRLRKKQGDPLVTGDVVAAFEKNGQWCIEDVRPRANEFVRQGLRRERQVLFANVDRVLILAALAQPQTKPAVIDRFLVAAMQGGIPAGLVLTKTDLDTDGARQREIAALYAAFDLNVFAVSNVTGEGCEAVGRVLQSGLTALVGNSGVGKSSLLNRLIPGLSLRVREVSARTGKGVHTTTAAVMVHFGEGAVIDTPGMKSFAPYGITRQNLVKLFPDIAQRAAECRFSDCRHGGEPDCAVHAAVEAGELAASRLRSYQRILAGLE